MNEDKLNNLARELTSLPGEQLSKALRAAYKSMDTNEIDIFNRMILDIQCEQREAEYANRSAVISDDDSLPESYPF